MVPATLSTPMVAADLDRARGVSDGWGADVAETHSAVVLLMGQRAYKVKKPVDLAFLDFTTLEARRSACLRELELNRRLSPAAYVGVAEVRDPLGEPCEYVLVMNRMPAARRLSTLVLSGVDVEDHVRRLARLMAAFHATAHTHPRISLSGTPRALRTRWLDNLQSLRESSLPTVPEPVLDRVEQLVTEWIRGREPLLQQRIEDGLVRDGHGDLLAEDIFCLPEGPVVLDCLDFSDELRWMDVLDDVACLAMDLERLGAPDQGAALLREYEEYSGVRQPDTLRHHYIAYRAVMRAKIAGIRAVGRSRMRGPDADEAAALCRIGLDHLRAARVHLVLVGGGPGTGKSTLAAGLADALGAVLLSSDRERKQLVGLAPTEHAPAAYRSGIYAPRLTERTYATVAQRAKALLGMGESVVVDASFARDDLREELRQAGAAAAAHVVELRCDCPADVVERRLRARHDHPDPYSDAGWEVGRRLAADFEAWPHALRVDTASSPGAALATAEALVRHDAR